MTDDRAGREWLTTGDVAEMFEVSIPTVQSWVDRGWLDDPVPAKRLPSGHRRIHRDSAARLLHIPPEES